MGVTKKYFHFFMAYHLAYIETVKPKNILKFYSRSLHQREAMPLYLTTPFLLATWDLLLGRQSISALPWVSNTVISFLLCVWWCMCAMVCLCVDQKTTYVGASSLPERGFWGTNPGCQDWLQAPLPAEPSH